LKIRSQKSSKKKETTGKMMKEARREESNANVEVIQSESSDWRTLATGSKLEMDPAAYKMHTH
jgi:hypothetical protein